MVLKSDGNIFDKQKSALTVLFSRTSTKIKKEKENEKQFILPVYDKSI